MRRRSWTSLLTQSTTRLGELLSARQSHSTRQTNDAYALADDANRYSDDQYEYRHVQLPKQMLKVIPKDYFDGARGTLKLLWEEEWRALGITQVGLHFVAIQ